MAGHLYNVPILNTADVTVTGLQTLCQIITPATRRAWILELALSGKSISSTDVPVRVELIRQTSAGTSGATITPVPFNPDYPAALCTVNATFSAEPSDGNVIPRGPWYVSPVGGLYVLQLPLGLEVEMPVSARLALRIFTAQATSIRANLVIQE